MRNEIIYTTLSASLVLAAAGCLTDASTTESAGARIDITDNQYIDNTTVPLEDLIWIYGTADASWSQGLRASGTVAVFPDVHARVELGGQDRVRTVTAGANEIGQLSSSLARRYGDDALPTQLNQLRAAALQNGNAVAWSETTYTRDGNPIGADARASVGGFGAEATTNVRLGLKGNDLEYRWVRAMSDANAGPDTSIPTTLAEAGQTMKPGECISMRGTGTVGFNFGVGSRLLFELPEAVDSDQHTIGAIADAALRVALETNQLDMQFCMLENGRAVIEAGVSHAIETSAHLAVAAGYGVHGLHSPSIRLGDEEVDARTVLDRALQMRLHEQFGNVFSVQAGAGVQEDVREGLVRLNVDTRTQDPKVLAAVGQFFMGDLRLAQELSRREHEGLKTELEVTRQGEVSWAGAGVNIFGLSLSAAAAETESEFSVRNPGGAASGFASREERSSGFLWNRAGYSRTVLAGVETPRGGVADSETGLYMSWRDIDTQMERSKLDMNTHGLLAQIVGPEAFAAIAVELDAAASYVQQLCGRAANESDSQWRARLDACRYDVQSHDAVMMRIDRATEKLEAALTAANVEENEAVLARSAMGLAVAAAKAYEFPALFTGAPHAAIESQAWLSEDALTRIMSHTGAEFAAALKGIDARADDGDLRDIAEEFDRGRALYNELNGIAEAMVAGGRKVGYDTIVVRLGRSEGRINVENITVTTLAKWRGDALAEMVDELLDEIGDVRFWNDRKARTFTYTMLALSGSDLRDYRFDFQMKLGGDDDHYRTAGYVDTRDDAIDQLDGVEDDHHAVTFRGSAVHHFGEGIGWTVNQMARLANIAN